MMIPVTGAMHSVVTRKNIEVVAVWNDSAGVIIQMAGVMPNRNSPIHRTVGAEVQPMSVSTEIDRAIASIARTKADIDSSSSIATIPASLRFRVIG